MILVECPWATGGQPWAQKVTQSSTQPYGNRGTGPNSLFIQMKTNHISINSVLGTVCAKLPTRCVCPDPQGGTVFSESADIHRSLLNSEPRRDGGPDEPLSTNPNPIHRRNRLWYPMVAPHGPEISRPATVPWVRCEKIREYAGTAPSAVDH